MGGVLRCREGEGVWGGRGYLDVLVAGRPRCRRRHRRRRQQQAKQLLQGRACSRDLRRAELAGDGLVGGRVALLLRVGAAAAAAGCSGTDA